MGGKSEQTTQQSSQTTPWGPASGVLGGILGKVGGISSDLSGGEQSALQGLLGNAGFLSNNFGVQATGLANNLLAGGGPDRTGIANSAYNTLQSQLTPYASGANLNPYSTPGFSDALGTLQSDITNQINSQFAGAGRDLSGMNTQTLARGLSQGLGGLIANQYNQNVQNQLGAANTLFGAGGQTAGLLSGLDQTKLANQQAGLGAAQTAGEFSNSPYLQTLAVEAQRRGIPLETLASQMGLVLPAAQAFSNQTGTSTTTKQMSPAEQFATITGGIGKLFGSGTGKAG